MALRLGMDMKGTPAIQVIERILSGEDIFLSSISFSCTSEPDEGRVRGPIQRGESPQSLVDEAGSKGIWIRSLRDNSGLSQLQAVGTSKKCYMPFDAVEDVSLTGGTFYSDRQLDLEVLQTLLTMSVNILASKRKMAAEIHPGDALSQRIASYASTTEATKFIRDKKFLNVPITDSDIGRILEVAVLDGLVDRRGDSSVRLLGPGGVKHERQPPFLVLSAPWQLPAESMWILFP